MGNKGKEGGRASMGADYQAHRPVHVPSFEIRPGNILFFTGGSSRNSRGVGIDTNRMGAKSKSARRG